MQIFYDLALINNPVAGIGDAVNKTDTVTVFRAVENIQVECNMYIEMIKVHDNNNTFDVAFWWHIRYQDDRVWTLTQTTPSQNCKAICSSDPTKILNENGTAACCEAVYVPNARIRNLAGIASKTFHNDFHILPAADSSEVNFWRRAYASFRGTLTYTGFPFKRQVLRVVILTDFLPYLSDFSFLEVPSSQGLPQYPSQIPAYDKKDLSIRGWQVVSLQANTLGVKYRLNGNNASSQASLQPGVSYTVHVQRRTSAFYTYLLVLPVCLLVLMSAFQCLSENGGLKYRMEHLGGIFFAMLFLQFGIQEYQPAALLIPPYIVIIGGYVLIALIAIGYVLADVLEQAPVHIETRKRWLKARIAFLHFQHKQQDLQKAGAGPQLRRRDSLLAYLTRDGSWSGAKLKAVKKAGWSSKHSKLWKKLEGLNNLSASRHRFSAAGSCGWMKYWWPLTWWKLAQMKESQIYLAALISAAERVWMPICIVGFYVFTTLVYMLDD